VVVADVADAGAAARDREQQILHPRLLPAAMAPPLVGEARPRRLEKAGVPAGSFPEKAVSSAAVALRLVLRAPRAELRGEDDAAIKAQAPGKRMVPAP
jgi:hypothetical protein